MISVLYSEYFWLFVGFFGQFVFFLRFILQWWVSEKEKKIVIPKGFWYLSIVGTIIILIYSIHIHDIVFITAQILSMAIYVRNLSFKS